MTLSRMVGPLLALSVFLMPPIDPLRSSPGERPAQATREVQLASLYGTPLPSVLTPRTESNRQERAGHWNGVPDERLLGRIQTQPIKMITFNRAGSSLSLRLHFQDGSSAAFKPEQIHIQTVPRKEIAAYRLNRLLGMARVPPATWRILSYREVVRKLGPRDRHLAFRIRKEAKFRKGRLLAGEVSWWIPRIRYMPIDKWKARKRWFQWLKAYKRLRPRHAGLTAQLSKLCIFDFLINNPDRFSGYNTMATPDLRFLFFMDNTYSFYPLARGGKRARTGLHRVMRYSRSLVRRLKGLTYAKLKRAMAVKEGAPFALLTEPELRAVIARRNYAVQVINRVIARYGWEKTMVFP